MADGAGPDGADTPARRPGPVTTALANPRNLPSRTLSCTAHGLREVDRVAGRRMAPRGARRRHGADDGATAAERGPRDVRDARAAGTARGGARGVGAGDERRHAHADALEAAAPPSGREALAQGPRPRGLRRVGVVHVRAGRLRL